MLLEKLGSHHHAVAVIRQKHTFELNKVVRSDLIGGLHSCWHLLSARVEWQDWGGTESLSFALSGYVPDPNVLHGHRLESNITNATQCHWPRMKITREGRLLRCLHQWSARRWHTR